MKEENATCQNCKFCALYDTGYSNYTVMGTDFECLKNKDNKNNGLDLFGLDLTPCESFSNGEPLYHDVDGEIQYEESEVDEEVWSLYKNNEDTE